MTRLSYRIKTHLEPLAIAANIAQAAHTRLDHILLTLANLYRIFDTDQIDNPLIRETVQGSLERRWKAVTEQDCFILAVFFNPYIRASCFNAESLTPNRLIQMAKSAFKRFYDEDADTEFIKAILDYSNRAGNYSDAAMLLDDHRKMADNENKVSCPF